MANGMYEIGGVELFGDEYGADELAGADEIGGVELYGAEEYGDEYGDEYGAPSPRRPARLLAARRPHRAPQGQLAALQAEIRRLRANQAQLAAGAGAARLPTGLQIRETAPQADRELTVNFASTGNIAAGALSIVTSQPQVQVFRGERLMLPESTVGQYFVIEDVLVGKNSQLAGTGVGQSGILFSEKAVGAGQRFDPCTLGMVITLKVRNIDTNPRAFFASIFGRAVFLPSAFPQVLSLSLARGKAVTVTRGATWQDCSLVWI